MMKAVVECCERTTRGSGFRSEQRNWLNVHHIVVGSENMNIFLDVFPLFNVFVDLKFNFDVF